jgi:hypothetical protein
MSWNPAIKWIMLVSGALTCTMLYAAVAPEAAMRATFGEALEGALAPIVVRNWGVLVGLMGALLIYGAYHPESRRLALAMAGTSKLVFSLLVLTAAPLYRSAAAIPVTIDLMWVAVFAAYLVSARTASVTLQPSTSD